jgi:serine/threonine protein kinase
VKWLSDGVLAHLCKIAAWPDLSGTRYELVKQIGQGGMGAVYLARDCQLDRPVALKILHSGSQSTEATARMVHEARIIARLEHPSIVPVHDSGLLPDGRFYYAMKLVRGKRLDERVESQATLVERLQLFQKICDAVAFAHAHGIIHRDLKPQNIMLGTFGEVQVMDWGIAKEVGDHPEAVGLAAPGECGTRAQTGHGTIVGTPGYMAPEQARGDQDLIDERADVYSLGAILYFLLARRAPVHEPAPGSSGVQATPVLTPRRYDRSIPRPLAAVCLKALAAERTERYAGASDLAADIAAFLARRRVRAYPERYFEAALRLGAKYRAALALILAYLIMRILLLFFMPR